MTLREAADILNAIGTSANVIESAQRVLDLPSESWEPRRKAGIIGEEERVRKQSAESIEKCVARIVQLIEFGELAVDVIRAEVQRREAL